VREASFDELRRKRMEESMMRNREKVSTSKSEAERLLPFQPSQRGVDATYP